MKETSELRPEGRKAVRLGKSKGRNLGSGNDKCKGPEAGRNRKEVVVAGPDERERWARFRTHRLSLAWR